MRVVTREARAFWRLWDRARAAGAERKEGTSCLVWSTSRGSTHPCVNPRYGARIVGVRSRALVRRRRRPDTIHRVRLKGGVIDYPLHGGDIVQLAAGTQVEWGSTLGWIELWGRCRMCSECEAHKRRLWIARATTEMALCRGRTWFGTLTASPATVDRLEYAAIQRCNRTSVNWHELPIDAKRRVLFREFYGELQKYLKRVREELRTQEGGRRIRFFAVLEAHKSGLPHAHMLIHEESLAAANERTLRRQWKAGFSQWRLVHGKSDVSSYVTKYLTKAAVMVRASNRYGRSLPALLSEAQACGAVQAAPPVPPPPPPPPHTPPPTEGGGGQGGEKLSLTEP